MPCGIPLRRISPPHTHNRRRDHVSLLSFRGGAAQCRSAALSSTSARRAIPPGIFPHALPAPDAFYFSGFIEGRLLRDFPALLLLRTPCSDH